MTTQRDFAAAVPLRFTDALHAEEIDPDQYLAGCYVAALCEQCRNTSGGVATVRLADVAGLLRMDVEHLRRKLRALEPEWVELDTTKGRGAVWKVRLTGLVWEPRGKTTPADSRGEFHRNSTESTPPEWNFNSTGGISADGAKPVPERDSTGSEIPLEASGEHPTRHDTTQHNTTINQGPNGVTKARYVVAEDERRDEEGRGGEERRLTLDEIEERYPSVRELRERMGLIGKAMP